MSLIIDNYYFIFFTLLILFQLQFFLLNLYVKLKTRSKVRGKSTEATVFILCVLALYTIVFINIFYPTDHIIFNKFIPKSNTLLLVALFVLLLGFTLGIFSSINLGKSWRVGVSTDMNTVLVQSGIYKFIRNPYFLSYCFILVSVILAFPNILIVSISVIALFFIHKMILAEEAHLFKVHGATYIEFKKKTWRYFPPF